MTGIGVWQRRFWEHLIRDDRDLAKYIAYVHWNPVNHGYVIRVADWPYSSFHRYVARGLYPLTWASHAEDDDEQYGGGALIVRIAHATLCNVC